MTVELSELFGGSIAITGDGLSYVVDNMIMLRYVEVGSELKRAMAVIKTRGSDHDKGLRKDVIDGSGLHLGSKFADLEGVMTGMPQP